MKVKNMESVRSGKAVPNQYIITDGETSVFQSYETAIAKRIGRSVYLDTNVLNYSKTTSKYLYAFIGMGRKGIEQAIKGGEIEICDLNKMEA